jgi:hypothetical protein
MSEDLRPAWGFSTVNESYFRFHSARHFQSSPDMFWLNFLDTPRTFIRQDRFAPAYSHSGFYFGSSAAVATAEMAFYSAAIISRPIDQLKPIDFLRNQHSRGRDLVFIEVHVEIDEIVDFTDAELVERFLRFGRARYRARQPEYWVQYLTPLISESAGGNNFTDVLGLDAFGCGANGVLFPSVRSLLFEQSVPFGIRLGFDHALPGGLGSDGNIMDLQWQLQEQLKREHNLVLFSGPRLLSSIHAYRWRDSNNTYEEHENPFYGATARELENIRLAERHRLGLDAVTAADLGLLSEEEQLSEFRSRVMWVRDQP